MIMETCSEIRSNDNLLYKNVIERLSENNLYSDEIEMIFITRIEVGVVAIH